MTGAIATGQENVARGHAREHRGDGYRAFRVRVCRVKREYGGGTGSLLPSSATPSAAAGIHIITLTRVLRPMVTVDFFDLLFGFAFVNADVSPDNRACIGLLTGQVHVVAPELGIDEEVPEDFGDPALYVAIPSRRELSLGRDLVLSFVAKFAPDDVATVHEYFSRRGAYPRYRELLERRQLLGDWHDYETVKTDEALRAWCAQQGIAIAIEQGQG
jgi:hypothetical protein